MKTAEFLVYLLARYGVKCVFGIPGVHTLALYDALGSAAGIRHFTPRHEQSAGFMADGYARRSGMPGVCFIISGPGMTNISTAMAQAYADSIPMLVISSVNAHGHMGSGDGWLHELPNQQALVEGVCEFSHTVHDASELPQVIARAFAVFDSARPRPVHIELPLNVLDCVPPRAMSNRVLRLSAPSPDLHTATQAATLLASARTPLILAGGGALGARQDRGVAGKIASADASTGSDTGDRTNSNALTALAERIDAPVIMTVNARGVLPASHPLEISMTASLPATRALIEQADVVLAIGTELGPTDYDFNEDGGLRIPGTLIRIDIDPQQLVRTHLPDIGLVADAGLAIRALLELLTAMAAPPASREGARRASRCRQDALLSMSARDRVYLRLLDTIRDCLPGVCLVGDSTQVIYAGNAGFSAGSPWCYFNSATGYGTLGYGLPAAIGAAIASPDRPVVVIAGDGGLQFCLAELATAVDAKVAVTLIVHQNGGYGEIRKYMQANAIAPLGVNLLVPDMLAVATACGWRAQRLQSLQELTSSLCEAQALAVPTLLLLPDEVFD